MTRKIPVTLLTGFLGAGKTTLLNAFMEGPESGETAVVINEFGEVNLDRSLLGQHDADLFTSNSGCMCCTAGSDVRDSLLTILNAVQAKCRGLERVIVETTGLADPTPIIAAFYAQPRSARDVLVARNFELSQVVTLVDALHGDMTLDYHFEALRQVAFADTLILTKTDLMSDPASRRDTEELAMRLAGINPGVSIVDGSTPQLERIFLQHGSYSPEHRPTDARAWLAAESIVGPRHDHTHQDLNRHDERVRAYCLTHDAPVPYEAVQRFLTLLSSSAGPRLLRIKGLIATREAPEQPILLHGVQRHLQEPRWLGTWPDAEDRRSRLVIIGRDLDERGIDALFDALVGRTGRPSGWLARLRERLAPTTETPPDIAQFSGGSG